jgi:hypothetical protein
MCSSHYFFLTALPSEKKKQNLLRDGNEQNYKMLLAELHIFKLLLYTNLN